MHPSSLITTGDSRRIIVETIMALKSGEMTASTGMAIAANMKVLNDSIQIEINAAKMAISAQQLGHDFGRVVSMGQRLIGNDTGQLA